MASPPANLNLSAPYLLAVVGLHADTQAFLRDVEWIAQERAMSFVLAIYERGKLHEWLLGKDVPAGTVGERWSVPQFLWTRWSDVGALFTSDGIEPPSAVIFGPARATRWLPGMPASARPRI